MAGNYSTAFPANAALADPDAEASYAGAAPAIVAGAPRTLADITNARHETESRKRQKKSRDTGVTDDEVSRSVARQQAITAEYNEGIYGGVGAPVWAVPLLALVPSVANLNASVAAIDARQRNETSRRRNNQDTAIITGNAQLRPLYKVNPDIGPPLPGQAAQYAGAAAAQVGTQYPAVLPQGPASPLTISAIDGMSSARISLLSEWANDDFGIVAGDTAAARRMKLRTHFTLW